MPRLTVDEINRNIHRGDVPGRHRFMAKTADEWYPNFPNDEVRISAMELVDHNNGGDINMTRVCIWGADDCGMEIDFPIAVVNFELAKLIAESLPTPITKFTLKKLGFGPA